MPCPTKPAYICLRLRSCDDHVGQVTTWRGLVGGQQPLLIELTLAYDEGLATLPTLTRLIIAVQGTERLFALLSVTPSSQASEYDLTVLPLPDDVPAGASERLVNLGYAASLEFQATDKLAKDMDRLLEWLELRDNVQQVALGSANRFHKN